MAKKIEAVPQNKKPPLYEISPKWIIIYQIANFVAVLFVVFYICAYKNGLPFLCYFMFQFVSIIIQFLFTIDPPTYIFTEFHHPDLLSAEKISYLRKLCTKARDERIEYEFKEKPLPADFIEESYYQSLIDAQKKLHLQCLFLKLLGTPKVQVEESKADSTEKKNIHVENVKHSQETKSKNNAEIPVKRYPSSIENMYDESDVGLKSAFADTDSKVSFISDKPSTDCPSKNLDKNDIMKSDIKNIKSEIAELKFEFLKLQKTLETVVESKTVF